MMAIIQSGSKDMQNNSEGEEKKKRAPASECFQPEKMFERIDGRGKFNQTRKLRQNYYGKKRLDGNPTAV
jgi:hypothetical protein